MLPFSQTSALFVLRLHFEDYPPWLIRDDDFSEKRIQSWYKETVKEKS